jgi:beta-lactamase superfamily II metal-dependent hydrolase
MAYAPGLFVRSRDCRVRSPSGGQTGPQNAGHLYLDVEGGNATLFVSPSGDSLLIDTGNAGPAAARDAGRIIAAIQDSGVREIDHLITTHWHGDHFGGLAELASRITIREFIDHGPNVQPGEAADTFSENVPQLAPKRSTVVKADIRFPMAGLDVRVVTSAGETIKASCPAQNAESYCASFKPGITTPRTSVRGNLHSVPENFVRSTWGI